MTNKNNYLVIILAIAISSVLTGFGTYYLLSNNNTQNAGQSTINELKQEIQSLNNKLTTNTNSTLTSNQTPPVTTMETDKPIKEKELECALDEMVVVFNPGGSFSQSDKNNLTNFLTEPFDAFYNEDSLEYISLMVVKNAPPIAGYYYKVTAITKDGAYQDFLFSQSSTNIEWWLPECLNGCKFSDSFKQKYPDIVSAYQ